MKLDVQKDSLAASIDVQSTGLQKLAFGCRTSWIRRQEIEKKGRTNRQDKPRFHRYESFALVMQHLLLFVCFIRTTLAEGEVDEEAYEVEIPTKTQSLQVMAVFGLVWIVHWAALGCLHVRLNEIHKEKKAISATVQHVLEGCRKPNVSPCFLVR